jgi:hypothetical protein
MMLVGCYHNRGSPLLISHNDIRALLEKFQDSLSISTLCCLKQMFFEDVRIFHQLFIIVRFLIKILSGVATNSNTDFSRTSLHYPYQKLCHKKYRLK